MPLTSDEGARRPKEIRALAAHSQPWGQFCPQNWPDSSPRRPELGGLEGSRLSRPPPEWIPLKGVKPSLGEDFLRAGALVGAQQR